MKLVSAVPLMIIVVTSSSLSAQTVKVNWLVKAHFADYKSYAWRKSTSVLPEFFTQFVQPDVDVQLAAKSLRQLSAAQMPDLFVTYHVQTQESPDSNTTTDGFVVDGDSWGFSDCWDGCGWGQQNDQTPTTAASAPHSMAILTVDLADARTNKLVWRAQAAIDSVAKTQKGDEKQIARTVERMFKKYPQK